MEGRTPSSTRSSRGRCLRAALLTRSRPIGSSRWTIHDKSGATSCKRRRRVLPVRRCVLRRSLLCVLRRGPVLLFYLPFAPATGELPTAIGVLVMASRSYQVLGFARPPARYHFKRVSLGVPAPRSRSSCAADASTSSSSDVLLAAHHAGLAFLVWGLYCWMAGITEARVPWFMLSVLHGACEVDAGPAFVFSFLAFPLSG